MKRPDYLPGWQYSSLIALAVGLASYGSGGGPSLSTASLRAQVLPSAWDEDVRRAKNALARPRRSR